MSDKIKNFIITLTGPSGCGKTTLIKQIMGLEEKLSTQGIKFYPYRVPKYGTRSLRSTEIKDDLEGKGVDLISVDHIPESCKLKYQTYGKKYGLELYKISNLLEDGKTPIIVINDIRVVEELKKSFPERVLSLFLFREVPRRDTFLKEASLRGNVTDSETEERFNKATAIYRTFIENIGLFSRVILNPTRTLGSEDYAQIQIENVVKGVLNGKISLKAKKNGMPKLFIIAGNAASGKDEIIQAVNDMGKLQAFIIPKYTSRRQDKEDGSEMICKYIPKNEKMKKYEEDYRIELLEKQDKFEHREKEAGKDIEKLSKVRERNLKEKRAILTAEKRFWNAIKEKSDEMCSILRKKILEEALPEYFLANVNLFGKDFDELCELYKTKGYHKEGIDVIERIKNAEKDEQKIFNLIEEEVDVEHDLCRDKLKPLNEKQLWDIYQKDGYHSAEVDVDGLRQDYEKKILDEFFEYNSNYIDLEKINQEYKLEIEEKTKGQILKVTGPAYYIEVDSKGLVMYENNKTLYAFQVSDLIYKNALQYEQMLKQNKHCVLVASLIDIFKICKPYFKDNIVTVFSYSEISSEEFAKKSTAGTVERKIENFENEIKKYSEYIADFDHVTIYAESELDKRNGGRKEELIDQIFRLFRYYSSYNEVANQL